MLYFVLSLALVMVSGLYAQDVPAADLQKAEEQTTVKKTEHAGLGFLDRYQDDKERTIADHEAAREKEKEEEEARKESPRDDEQKNDADASSDDQAGDDLAENDVDDDNIEIDEEDLQAFADFAKMFELEEEDDAKKA